MISRRTRRQPPESLTTATLERIGKYLEANGANISVPDNRTFETEGEAIERGVRRTIEGCDIVTRNLIGAIYRFRDAVLV